MNKTIAVSSARVMIAAAFFIGIAIGGIAEHFIAMRALRQAFQEAATVTITQSSSDGESSNVVAGGSVMISTPTWRKPILGNPPSTTLPVLTFELAEEIFAEQPERDWAAIYTSKPKGKRCDEVKLKGKAGVEESEGSCVFRF